MRSIHHLRGGCTRLPRLAQAAQYTQHRHHSTARSRLAPAARSAVQEGAGASRGESGSPSTSGYPHVSVLLNEVLQSFRGMRLQVCRHMACAAGRRSAAACCAQARQRAALHMQPCVCVALLLLLLVTACAFAVHGWCMRRALRYPLASVHVWAVGRAGQAGAQPVLLRL